MPLVAGCRKTAADPVRKALAELQRPLPDRLMADQDAPGGEHLLDHAQAEREPEVEPDGMADHLSRKAMTGIARMTGLLHPSYMPQFGHPPVNLTVPLRDGPSRWALKLGPAYTRRLRRKTPSRRDIWHLDEVVVTISGQKHWLWRAVDQDGYVLDDIVQSRRNTTAAKRLLRRLLRKQGCPPRRMITDRLGSYAAAQRLVTPASKVRWKASSTTAIGAWLTSVASGWSEPSRGLRTSRPSSRRSRRRGPSVDSLENTSGLLAAARQRSVTKRRAVEEILGTMRRNGEVISFKTVAERANVSREYLYRQFKEVIQQLRTTALQQVVTVDGEEVRVRSAGRAATIEVALRHKVKRLESELAEVRQQKMELDRRYERALGEAEEWRSRHQRAVTELLEVRSRLTRYGSS